jgi:hypothetical protein
MSDLRGFDAPAPEESSGRSKALAGAIVAVVALGAAGAYVYTANNHAGPAQQQVALNTPAPFTAPPAPPPTAAPAVPQTTPPVPEKSAPVEPEPTKIAPQAGQAVPHTEHTASARPSRESTRGGPAPAVSPAETAPAEIPQPPPPAIQPPPVQTAAPDTTVPQPQPQPDQDTTTPQ